MADFVRRRCRMVHLITMSVSKAKKTVPIALGVTFLKGQFARFRIRQVFLYLTISMAAVHISFILRTSSNIKRAFEFFHKTERIG